MRLTRSWLGDVALVVGLAVVGVVGTAGADANTQADLPIDATGYGLVVAAPAILLLRRRAPLVTLAIATILTSAYLTVGYVYGPIFFSFWVAVYSVARYLPLARSVPASAAALPLLLIHLFTNSAALSGFLGLIPATAWVVVPFAIGCTVRLTQQSVAQARAEAVRQRVDDERLRVAQEVHDVVGHGLAAIKMQADVALHVLHKKPEQAELALSAISRTSTDALDELRATLAVVRQSESDAVRTPAAGLAQLDELGRRMRDAGVEVRLRTDGAERALSSAVDLAGYRIVQESLTNVLRHSDARVATVGLSYEADALLITVSNEAGRLPTSNEAGRLPTSNEAGPMPTHRGGLGIPGMRQRVTQLGGDFSAGPTEDGRFEVRASLPTGARA